MFVVRTPLRITLGGGGSDLPDNPDGFCVTATIDKYIYSMASRPFTDEIVVHHHQGTERVSTPDLLQHRLLRAIISRTGVFPVEFSGMSEIPAGTGLGSSSAFTVGAYHALRGLVGHYTTREDLAKEAAATEVGHLHDPIGYQDQFATALGGIRWLQFRDGHVTTQEVYTDHSTWNALNRNLRLFYTGISRSAADQMGSMPPMDLLREQGLASCKALQAGDLEGFAQGLNQQWAAKLLAAPTVTHFQINEQLWNGRHAGALGGKLIGAGNGGFLLFYAASDVDLSILGLREVPINLTMTGTEKIG